MAQMNRAVETSLVTIIGALSHRQQNCGGCAGGCARQDNDPAHAS